MIPESCEPFAGASFNLLKEDVLSKVWLQATFQDNTPDSNSLFL